jgi:hypothetical protein
VRVAKITSRQSFITEKQKLYPNSFLLSEVGTEAACPFGTLSLVIQIGLCRVGRGRPLQELVQILEKEFTAVGNKRVTLLDEGVADFLAGNPRPVTALSTGTVNSCMEAVLFSLTLSLGRTLIILIVLHTFSV